MQMLYFFPCPTSLISIVPRILCAKSSWLPILLTTPSYWYRTTLGWEEPGSGFSLEAEFTFTWEWTLWPTPKAPTPTSSAFPSPRSLSSCLLSSPNLIWSFHSMCFLYWNWTFIPLLLHGHNLSDAWHMLHLSLPFLPPLSLSKAVVLDTGYTLESLGEIFFKKHPCPGLTPDQWSQDFWCLNLDNLFSSQGDPDV